MSNPIQHYVPPSARADLLRLEASKAQQLQTESMRVATVAAKSVAAEAGAPRITVPASEKATRLAELEIQTTNQRDRLHTAQKTQEFLHHDRESGLSYYLIDGTLVPGNYRGGEGKVDRVGDRGAAERLSDLEIQNLLSEANDAAQRSSDTARRQQETDDQIRHHLG